MGVEMEDDGISIEKLEQALKENKNTKFLYLIPNFQNPSGITMSLEKRKAVYELALKYGVLIFEDNPYGDLRFAGEPVPNIKSMDTEGIVIYAGSFSKTLSQMCIRDSPTTVTTRKKPAALQRSCKSMVGYFIL